jgi:hypothetical protein
MLHLVRDRTSPKRPQLTLIIPKRRISKFVLLLISTDHGYDPRLQNPPFNDGHAPDDIRDSDRCEHPRSDPFLSYKKERHPYSASRAILAATKARIPNQRAKPIEQGFLTVGV